MLGQPLSGQWHLIGRLGRPVVSISAQKAGRMALFSAPEQLKCTGRPANRPASLWARACVRDRSAACHTTGQTAAFRHRVLLHNRRLYSAFCTAALEVWYRTRQYYESKVLHITQAIRFSKAHCYLASHYFYRPLSFSSRLYCWLDMTSLSLFFNCVFLSDTCVRKKGVRGMKFQFP